MRNLIIGCVLAITFSGCLNISPEVTDKVEDIWDTGRTVGKIILPEDKKIILSPIADMTEEVYKATKEGNQK